LLVFFIFSEKIKAVSFWTRLFLLHTRDQFAKINLDSCLTKDKQKIGKGENEL